MRTLLLALLVTLAAVPSAAALDAQPEVAVKDVPAPGDGHPCQAPIDFGCMSPPDWPAGQHECGIWVSTPAANVCN